jgi:hypothetical protein
MQVIRESNLLRKKSPNSTRLKLAKKPTSMKQMPLSVLLKSHQMMKISFQVSG